MVLVVLVLFVVVVWCRGGLGVFFPPLSEMAEKVQYVEQNVNATYAMVQLSDDTIVALLEVCQCRRPLCLLQHGDGNCKITVTRKKTTRKRTPYCFVCKHQKHFLDALAAQVRMLCLFQAKFDSVSFLVVKVYIRFVRVCRCTYV